MNILLSRTAVNVDEFIFQIVGQDLSIIMEVIEETEDGFKKSFSNKASKIKEIILKQKKTKTKTRECEDYKRFFL